MGDYPAQKFRYGFVVKTSEIELAEEKFDELDGWFRETFPDFTGFGFDDGLVYFSGWASSGEKVLVGVPILADAAVSTDKNLSAYLGGYVAGEFDVDAF